MQCTLQPTTRNKAGDNKFDADKTEQLFTDNIIHVLE